jgi:hypothetical protein
MRALLDLLGDVFGLRRADKIEPAFIFLVVTVDEPHILATGAQQVAGDPDYRVASCLAVDRRFLIGAQQGQVPRS